ncbi:MAG: GtrA family protein, partial [Anaerolineales bacterium]|nr:GtrA family protein [Anaerolineales bacterium]
MTTIITNARERTRFARFAVVGVIGAVVDFGVLNLLIHFLQTPLVLAGTISFFAAILNNFTWNRFWTYPDSRSKRLPAQLVQFSLVSVIGIAIRIPILALLKPVIEAFLLQIAPSVL